MDRDSFPSMPPPPAPAEHSNILTYVVIGIVLVGAAGFFFLLFGELFLIALTVFLLIGTVGGLHYLTWGRAMTEQAKKDAKARLEEE